MAAAISVSTKTPSTPKVDDVVLMNALGTKIQELVDQALKDPALWTENQKKCFIVLASADDRGFGMAQFSDGKAASAFFVENISALKNLLQQMPNPLAVTLQFNSKPIFFHPEHRVPKSISFIIENPHATPAAQAKK